VRVFRESWSCGIVKIDRPGLRSVGGESAIRPGRGWTATHKANLQSRPAESRDDLKIGHYNDVVDYPVSEGFDQRQDLPSSAEGP